MEEATEDLKHAVAREIASSHRARAAASCPAWLMGSMNGTLGSATQISVRTRSVIGEGVERLETVAGRILDGRAGAPRAVARGWRPLTETASSLIRERRGTGSICENRGVTAD